VDHLELFVRLNDPENGVIKASRFNSAVESVGYEGVLDKAVIVSITQYLKDSRDSNRYAINLHVVPFADRNYFKWFRDELLQISSELRVRLIFEFAEAKVVQHLDYMRPVIKMIAGLGCQVAIGQAGRSIVSTHYLKELPVSQLKLHRSLVKKIDQRHENQLFVRSLLGACAGLKTQVIAVGVDNKQEYQSVVELGVHGIQGRYLEAEQQLLPKQTVKQSVVATPNKVQIGRRNRWRKT